MIEDGYKSVLEKLQDKSVCPSPEQSAVCTLIFGKETICSLNGKTASLKWYVMRILKRGVPQPVHLIFIEFSDFAFPLLTPHADVCPYATQLH